MSFRLVPKSVTLNDLEPEMEPGHGSPGHWVTESAILTGSGRVTGQCVRSVFDQLSSFNMRVYRGIVSTE